tara:strand:- start:134 stop:343 length:210 start_codon:yes stop_codon:yes gene_type:complete
MESNNNEFYGLKLWLNENERSQSWLSKRLQISPMTISKWKRENKIPHVPKLAICHVTGATFQQLWGTYE